MSSSSDTCTTAFHIHDIGVNHAGKLNVLPWLVTTEFAGKGMALHDPLSVHGLLEVIVLPDLYCEPLLVLIREKVLYSCG